jgi:ketosteroid isomerase-like protein
LTFAAVSLSVTTVAQSSKRNSSDGTRIGKKAAGAEAEVLRLEDAWAAALVRHDVKMFRRVLAVGMIYTENDQMSTGEALLRDLEGSKDKIDSARNDDMKTHRFGPAIVVTGSLTVRGQSKDGPFDHKYRFTDVWMRRGSGKEWQIVAAHDYLKPAE